MTLPDVSFNAVASIPVRFEPSPLNCNAVTTPVYVACPFDSIVTPVPTAIELPEPTFTLPTEILSPVVNVTLPVRP